MLVRPEDQGQLMLNEYVRGQIDITSRYGVIVPRSAVLPENDSLVLYSVKESRAHRHIVNVVMQTDSLALVDGGIAAGDSVVVLGNYELEDGMAVYPDTSAVKGVSH